jgi:hypothetical protein
VRYHHDADQGGMSFDKIHKSDNIHYVKFILMLLS